MPSDPIFYVCRRPDFREDCLDDEQENGSYALGMAPSDVAHRMSLKSTYGASFRNTSQTTTSTLMLSVKADSRPAA